MKHNLSPGDYENPMDSPRKVLSAIPTESLTTVQRLDSDVYPTLCDDKLYFNQQKRDNFTCIHVNNVYYFCNTINIFRLGGGKTNQIEIIFNQLSQIQQACHNIWKIQFGQSGLA